MRGDAAQPEGLDGLTSATRAELGDDPMKVELYEYKQAILVEVREALIEQIIDSTLELDDLLQITPRPARQALR